jgi:hypothetical protein
MSTTAHQEDRRYLSWLRSASFPELRAHRATQARTYMSAQHLAPVCLTRDQANAWIELHHRHHKRVSGHRFIVGAVVAGELVGIAVAGRPRARLLQQYENLEVNRLCSDGSRNVCSFLYSRVSRVAQELGFATCFTAILESEPGASLRASGWLFAYSTKGGTQNRPSRPRVDKSPIEPKQIWAAHWCLDAVRALNREQSERGQVQS